MLMGSNPDQLRDFFTKCSKVNNLIVLYSLSLGYKQVLVGFILNVTPFANLFF
jgi:hypothetical protein